MSAMTTSQAMLEEEVREGSINLSDTSKWFCGVHETWVKTGKDCLFCQHDQFGDAIFADIPI